MDSQIEEIKNKLNVLDVVGGYVKLTKTGINYRGVCPFHSEKKPSFFVSPHRQMFKCFGCGAGGDIFEFVKKIEGVEFGDALRILAVRAGVELKKENPKLKTERQRLYEICDLACSFFEKQLQAGNVGKEAKEYLKKRGISEDSIKKWRLGYSPDTWQGLSDFLVGRGYKREEVIKAGLAVASERGKDPYDRFRGRIIFPIFDSNSQVVGFGARVFKDINNKEVAKYINTPQTLLYDKSNILYGMNFAKVPARKNNQCVLVEGYTDAIMAHQAGFENTVAASGTALTDRHLNILKRYTENLVLAFDMDLAGDTATKRGINLAESQGFNIKVINSYAEKDPADIILEDAKIWEGALLKARSIMDYYFDSAFSLFNKALPEGKKNIGKIILPAVKRIQNKIEQSYWVQKLAEKLGVREEAIMAEMASLRQNAFKSGDVGHPAGCPTSGAEGAISPSDAVGRKNLLEQKIISLVMKNPENLNLIEEPDYCLFCDQAKNFLQNLKNPQNEVSVKNTLSREFRDELALRAEVEFSAEGGPASGWEEQEIQLCLAQLKEIFLRGELVKMTEEIKTEQDQQKKEELIKEFSKKAKLLHQKI